MSDDEAERPPPYSLEDDGEGTPAKKRTKSRICGATLENGQPCTRQAQYDGVGALYCHTHQEARMHCVDCGVAVKYTAHTKNGH